MSARPSVDLQAPPTRERIERAKADWKAGRFGKIPGDDREYIPLPEE